MLYSDSLYFCFDKIETSLLLQICLTIFTKELYVNFLVK